MDDKKIALANIKLEEIEIKTEPEIGDRDEVVGGGGDGVMVAVKKYIRRLTLREKESLLNVFHHHYTKLKNKSVAVKIVAEAFDISERTVYGVLKEKKSTGMVSSPKKSSGRPSILKNIDEVHLNGIRRKFHEFFFASEIPTLNKLIKAVKKDQSLPSIGRTTLYRLLKRLNIKYVTNCRDSFLADNEKIVVWRRRYLRNIKRLRGEDKTIYYLDEICINNDHSQMKFLKDKGVASNKQEACVEGESVALKNSANNKDKRVITLHVGSSSGFVKDGLIIKELKKTKNHKEINCETFEKWFESILKKLKENSVIVMDTASCHSRKVEEIPTYFTKKDNIQQWLRDKNLNYEENMVKAELMAIVKKHKAEYDLYVVDEMAKSVGHTVLRLPPYHYELNPLEMVWAQIKRYVTANVKTFKLEEIKTLVNTAISNFTPEKWQACAKHVEEVIEKEMWEMDDFIDETAERLEINLGEDSSSDFDFEKLDSI